MEDQGGAQVVDVAWLGRNETLVRSRGVHENFSSDLSKISTP
jgi:hypothetical protein